MGHIGKSDSAIQHFILGKYRVHAVITYNVSNNASTKTVVKILKINGYKVPNMPEAYVPCVYDFYTPIITLMTITVKKSNIDLQKLLFVAKAQA